MGRLQPALSVDHADVPSWWSSDEWSTPQSFIDTLVQRYGAFDLDPCCRPETKKAPRFFTKAQNGLIQPWSGLVWVNPPYSNPRIWVEKAISEVHRNPSTHIIMLLPAAVDTAWFHDLVLPHGDVEFIRGRLRFNGWRGTPIGSPKGANLLAFFPPRD